MTMQEETKRPFAIRSIPFGVRTLAVLLVLTLALGYMVGERLKILTSGTEVLLKTKPVDPRDFFRGHYARLNFDISELPRPDDKPQSPLKENDPVFVRLKLIDDGYWYPVSTHATYPEPQSGIVVIKGRVKSTYSLRLQVTYGIERYFAPKAQAIKLENLDRKKTNISVLARISKSGEAAISGLMIDGKKIYEEPLF